MNEIDLAKLILEYVVHRNLATYRELFETSKIDDRSDPYWQGVLHLFSNLDDNHREILFSVVRQVMIDSVSSVLAIIDGVAMIPGHNEEFDLQINGRSVSGTLQDEFLEADEHYREGTE